MKTWIASLLLLACLQAGPAFAANVPDPHSFVGCYISMGYWQLPYANAQFAELAESGVNFVIDYALLWPEEPAQQLQFDAYLSLAERHGINVGYCLFNALEGATPRSSSVQIESALKQVRELCSRPQIGAWYVHDEILPELSGVDGTERYSLSLEQMEGLYLKIRELDPVRPQLCVWNQLPDCAEMNRRFSHRHFPHGFPEWMGHEAQFEECMQRMLRNTCDWVMVDCYPVGAGWLEDGQSLPAISAEIDELVRRAAALKSSEQPLIFVYQSFDWSIYGKGAQQTGFPSMQQLRAMLKAGYEAGADNVLAYSWFDLVRDANSMQAAEQARCFRDLKLILSELARQD